MMQFPSIDKESHIINVTMVVSCNQTCGDTIMSSAWHLGVIIFLVWHEEIFTPLTYCFHAISAYYSNLFFSWNLFILDGGGIAMQTFVLHHIHFQNQVTEKFQAENLLYFPSKIWKSRRFLFIFCVHKIWDK